MENKEPLTLSDFCYKTVIRKNDKAELIFGNYNDDETKPVRLMGFSCPAYLSDFEVQERGFMYFQDMIDESNRLKQKKNGNSNF